MAYGIDENGFNRKPFNEILADKNAAVSSAFDGEVNLDPQTPDGQINGLAALSDSLLWELIQYAYNAFDPKAASGTTLSNLVTLNGITRLGEESSNVTLDLTGDPLAVIPAGSLVSDGSANAELWETSEELTLDGAGLGSVVAFSQSKGEIFAAADSLTTIVTPVVGWSTVNNPLAANLGRDEETDQELRARRAISVAQPSQSLTDSVYSALANADGVDKVSVFENDTDTIDANGLIPHSIYVVIKGGVDEEIAELIRIEKSQGCQTQGNTEVTVTNSQGTPRVIKFERPQEVPIYIDLEISITGDFPSGGIDQIKQAFVDFFEGNEPYCGINIGDDVIYNSLFTPANSVGCSYNVVNMYVDTVSPPTGEADIDIDFDQLATIDIANINVTIV